MRLLELATKRKTSRRFKPTPVEEKDIKYILETGAQAPSGSNKQPWRFVVVKDQEEKQKIREASEEGERRFYDQMSPERKVWYIEKGLSPEKQNLTEAPVLLVVAGDTTAPNYKPSVWISIGYMVLAIEELGLATVTYTPSDPVIVSRAMGIPDDFIVEAILPLGYSGDTKTKETRMSIKELAFRDNWGNVF